MNRIPVVTKNLLAINVLMFLALLAFERQGIDLNNLLGLHLFIAPDFRPYQLLTYIFMHGSFTHIFVNMFSLWMFGRVLEQVWGSKRFLVYYLLTGIGAGLMQELVQFAYYYIELSAYANVNIGGGVIVPMAEYLNMFIVAAVAATIFLGGWMPLHIVGLDGFNAVMDYIPGFIWFFGKAFFVVFLLMWIKWTFPRLRIDQILNLEWKYLVPISMVNLVIMVLIVVFGLHF